MHKKTHIVAFAALTVLAVSTARMFAHRGTENPAQAKADIAAAAESAGALEARVPPPDAKKFPSRKWDVLDPQLTAKAGLVQSLDTDFPYYGNQTATQRPIASITKLVTAMVVVDDIGMNATVPVSKNAAATEALAGNLKAGETYNSGDLLKIMLLASSNKAAVAFEEYGGGHDVFIAKLNKKVADIGMTRTSLADSSGLSPQNVSTVGDLMLLAKHAQEKYPQIVAWTRLPSVLVQPLNGSESRVETNVNQLVVDPRFLGGKTGTSPEAGENLLAFMALPTGDRVAAIVLGSKARYAETKGLLDWIGKAYDFKK